MQSQRLTGPAAGVAKYDLITALATLGLAAGGSLQTSMLRLIALITARYNWAAEEVTIGQKEMAALWSCDPRTAKRETRRLIDLGCLEIKRAGVRGRVASYRLRRDEIARLSAGSGAKVGPDFEARMTPSAPPAPQTETAKVVVVDFNARNPREAAGLGPWAGVMAQLARDYPHLHDTWFAQLRAAEPAADQTLQVRAPSRFIAGYVATHHLPKLEAAVARAYGQSLRCSLTG